MSNSRKMKAIYNDIYHPSEVNDLFYNMLLLSKEFSHLLFDDEDIIAKLEYGTDASLRIASDAEILQMLRRFIILLIKLQPIEVLRMKPFVIVK